jgi:excisionase family DNA binding protein
VLLRFLKLSKKRLILANIEELKISLEQKQKEEAVALTYLTTAETCAFLKICRKTLYKFRMEGKIRYSKIGRKVLFKQTDLEFFVNSKRL